jgi:hypothetical protein
MSNATMNNLLVNTSASSTALIYAALNISSVVVTGYAHQVFLMSSEIIIDFNDK